MRHHPGTLALGLALAVTPSRGFVLPASPVSRLSSACPYVRVPVAATPIMNTNARVVRGRRKVVAPLQVSWLENVADFFTGEKGYGICARFLVVIDDASKIPVHDANHSTSSGLLRTHCPRWIGPCYGALPVYSIHTYIERTRTLD